MKRLRDGEVIPLDELERLTRRDFCQTVALAGAALAVLPACDGGMGPRVSTGGIEGGFQQDLAGAPPFDFAGVPRPDFGIGPPVDLANQPPPDFASQPPPPDFAQPQPPDLRMVTASCPGGVYNTNKAPSGFAMNTATFYSSQAAFVCRDAGGLFAMSSSCTHAGCDVNFRTSSLTFHCPCHSANFSYVGGIIDGPISFPLDHYATCVEANGSVAFNVNDVVDPATRM